MEHPEPQIDARLTLEPIPPSLPSPPPGPGCGVVLEFRRVVPAALDGAPISAVRYDVYESMALAKLSEIATTLARTHAAIGVTLIHRHGLIPAGDTVVYLAVRAPHRRAAVGCLEDIVEVMKRDVPIWRMGGVPCVMPPPIGDADGLPGQA